MSDRTGQFTEPIGRRVGARVRQPNRTLDFEAVKLEIIRLKKNSRSCHASAVTRKSNEIIGLISDDRNLHEVKEKLIHLDNAFQRLREAHNDYSIEILDEDGIVKCHLYLIELQQNALQLQQKRIVELLTLNQNKSKLPQPRLPVFDGNPIKYRTFVRAFESWIESRISSSTDMLHYLEQFTAGDVKELVQSCHHL